MFDAPSQAGLERCVITADVIEKRAAPLLVFRNDEPTTVISDAS
jgi:ATP-dependent protease Clp ATPase subunit